MATVPQKTLNWLWSVIQPQYRDAQRTYNEVAQTLSIHPSFSPSTKAYTFENGTSALLLNLSGTIAVNFRGSPYRFPVSIWIPQSYPFDSPIIYVTPTDDMIIRPGQHVSASDGRIYHPYLARWRDTWDRASIPEFLKILAEIFSREVPVMARQQGPPVPPQQPAARPIPQQQPPPRPPLPGQSQPVNQATGPPPPPKPYDQSNGFRPPSATSPDPRQSRYAAPPPLPGQGPAQRESTSPPPHMHHPQPQYQQQRPPSHVYQQMPGNQSQQQRYPSGPAPTPSHQFAPQPQSLPQQSPPQQPQPHPPQQFNQQQYSQPNPKPANIMDESPFDIALPTTSLPTPVIPPNPEKQHVLHTLQQTLLDILSTRISQNQSALSPLQSQAAALHSSQATLNSELQQLQYLQSQIKSNIDALDTTIKSADQTIESSKSQAGSKAGGQGAIDDLIIPPTVVSRQLYDCVADQRGYEAAIYALQDGFVRGRVGSDVWARKTRECAREEFRRKWMVKRIGSGMGLDGP